MTWRISDGGSSIEDICRIASGTLDNLPYMVHVVSIPDYRIVYINRRLQEFMQSLNVQVSTADLGKHPWDILPRWRETFLPIYEEARVSKRPRRIRDLEYHLPSGVVFLDVVLVPNLDDQGNVQTITSVRVDTTERRYAEDALRRSEENFRTLFLAAPIAAFTYSRDCVILRVNRAFERLYGFSEIDVIGRRIHETIGRPGERERTEEVVARVFNGETVENVEWNDVRSDGSPVYVLSSATPVYDATGRVVVGLSLNTDITERKMAERRTREMEEHKREFYRRTIQAATDGKLIVTERDEIQRIAGPMIASWEESIISASRFWYSRNSRLLRRSSSSFARRNSSSMRLRSLISRIALRTTIPLPVATGLRLISTGNSEPPRRLP
jgi:PAS domain S-box-containing protein